MHHGSWRTSALSGSWWKRSPTRVQILPVRGHLHFGRSMTGKTVSAEEGGSCCARSRRDQKINHNGSWEVLYPPRSTCQSVQTNYRVCVFLFSSLSKRSHGACLIGSARASHRDPCQVFIPSHLVASKARCCVVNTANVEPFCRG